MSKLQELEYFKPQTLGEAVELLNKYGKDIRVLAGGTDLIIALKDKIAVCSCLMDIKAIKELQNISYSDSEGLSIGAAVCLNDIIASDAVKINYPILVGAAKTLANSLIRNRATLIGNLCNASPGGDMLSPSIVLEGEAEIVSKRGSRKLTLKEFFVGVKKTTLKQDEMVTKVVFPSIKGQGRFLRKSRIKGHDLAQVSVSGFLKNEGGFNICIGAAGPIPIIVDDLENYKKADVNSNKEEIIRKVMGAIRPISDQRASKEFRTAMVEYLTRQILEELGKEV